MKPRASVIIEFGRCGWRIARKDVRLGWVRVWACRHSVLDHMTPRTLLVPVTPPRDQRGRFARVG